MFTYHIWGWRTLSSFMFSHHGENMKEDSILWPYIISLYGEGNQRWFHGNTTMESYHPEVGGSMFSEIMPQKAFVHMPWFYVLYLVLWLFDSNENCDTILPFTREDRVASSLGGSLDIKYKNLVCCKRCCIYKLEIT